MTNSKFISIIGQFQKGDRRGMQEIYEEYNHKIFATAYYHCHNRQDAYDISTNVIMDLYEYKGDPKQIRNHKGLLITMTKNEAINFLKSKSQAVQVVDMEFRQATYEIDTLWIDDILKVLDERDQKIFIEHVLWDKKLKDIAKALNIPYITVKRIYASVKIKVETLYTKK